MAAVERSGVGRGFCWWTQALSSTRVHVRNFLFPEQRLQKHDPLNDTN
jgi:hypothetical protein